MTGEAFLNTLPLILSLIALVLAMDIMLEPPEDDE